MAVLSKDELFTKVHSVLGKLETEESVSFLEDMTDTYNDMEQRANGDGENWKRKYEENDRAWSKRYSERFLHNPAINNAPQTPKEHEAQVEAEKASKITIDDLWSE